MSNHNFFHTYRGSLAKFFYLIVILSLLIPNGVGLSQSAGVAPTDGVPVTSTPAAATQLAQPTGAGGTPSPTSVTITPTMQVIATLTSTLDLSPTLTATSIVTPTATATQELPTSTATPTLIPTTALPPTASPTPVATSTPLPTSQPTVTLTPTITAVPTITATPTITSAVPITNGGITLTLAAAPGPVAVATGPFGEGDSITVTWRIVAVNPLLKGTELDITLPDGLKPDPLDKDIFDPETNTLRLTDPAESGALALIIGPKAYPPYFLQAALMLKDQTLADTTLSLNPTWSAEVLQKGGQVNGLNGKVKIEFPQSVLSQDLLVEIRRPEYNAKISYLPGGFPFEVNAKGKSDQSEVHKFTGKFTIEVGYDENHLPGPEEALSLFYYDEASEDWVPIPTTVITETHTLVASIDHLTLFDYDAQNYEAARLPSLNNFQVAKFTGAATYNFPIQVPAGPGGLQPSLNLSYNSQIVDNSTARTQASWVGMGWSLDVGYVLRNQNGTPDNDSDDTFSLTANGAGGLLVLGGDGYYHTTDETFWRITHDANDVWTAKDKVGNTYTFSPIGDYRSCPGGNRIWYWGLTSLTNIYNQSLAIDYAVDTHWYDNGSGCSGNVWTAAYPHTITYPNHRYQIQFILSGRSDFETRWDDKQYARVLFMKQRLSAIYVKGDADGDGNYEQTIRKYVLTYADQAGQPNIYPNVTWGAGGVTPTLYKITEYGLNETGPLPETKFTYGDSMHLTQADNGYGGTTNFNYNTWYDVNSGDRELCGTPSGQKISSEIYLDVFFSLYCGNFTKFKSYFQPGGAYKITVTSKAQYQHTDTMKFGIGEGSSKYIWSIPYSLNDFLLGAIHGNPGDDQYCFGDASDDVLHKLLRFEL